MNTRPFARIPAMKKKSHTPEQIVRILREAEAKPAREEEMQ